MQCLYGSLLGQNRRNQNTIPSFSAVLIRSSNWCVQCSGLLRWQAIMWTAHRIFVIHLSGMQGHRGAYLGLMVCAESKQSKPWCLHEGTQKHCRDRGCKRNCLSIQLLLWKVQEDHTPKLAVFILVPKIGSSGIKMLVCFRFLKVNREKKNTPVSLLCIMVLIILCGFLFFLMSSGYVGALSLEVSLSHQPFICIFAGKQLSCNQILHGMIPRTGHSSKYKIIAAFSCLLSLRCFLTDLDLS